MSSLKQLNPFELKTTLTKLLAKINSVSDIKDCLDDIELLDAQEDKPLITKLLFKELPNSAKEKIPITCFLLEHFAPKEELVAGLWELMKNKNMDIEECLDTFHIPETKRDEYRKSVMTELGLTTC